MPSAPGNKRRNRACHRSSAKVCNVILFPAAENIRCMLCVEESSNFKDLRHLWRHANKCHKSYLHIMVCNHCGCEYNDVSKATGHAKVLRTAKIKSQPMPPYLQNQGDKSAKSVNIPFPFSKEMVCPVCPAASVVKSSFWNLASHITRIHRNVSIYIECTQCTYKTEDVADIRIHHQACQEQDLNPVSIKMEEPPLVFRYPFQGGFMCHICLKSGKLKGENELLNYRDFRRHVGKKHANLDIKFVCRICEYVSKDLTVLKLHYVRCKEMNLEQYNKNEAGASWE